MTTFNPSDVTFAGTITEFVDAVTAINPICSIYHPPFTSRTTSGGVTTEVDVPNGMVVTMSIGDHSGDASFVFDFFDASTGLRLVGVPNAGGHIEQIPDPGSTTFTPACFKNCGMTLIGSGQPGFYYWWADDDDTADSRLLASLRNGLYDVGTVGYFWRTATYGSFPLTISIKDLSCLSKTPAPYLLLSAKAGSNAKLSVARLNVDPSAESPVSEDTFTGIADQEYDTASWPDWSNDPDTALNGFQIPAGNSVTGMTSNSVALMGIWVDDTTIHPVITSPRLATVSTFGGGTLAALDVALSHATSSARSHGMAVNQFGRALVCGTGGLLNGANDHLVEAYNAWDYSAPVWAKEHNSDATATFTVTTISTGTSSEGAHVHYLKNDSAPWPLPSDIVSIEINSVTYASGAIGSLANHEFAVGDIDSIGYSTLYFRRDESDGITGGIILTYGDGKGLGGGYATSAETHIYNPIPTGKSWLVFDHDADETRVFEYDYDGNFIRRFQLSDTAMPSPTTFNGTVGVNYNTYGTTEGAGEYIVGLLPGPTDPGWAKPTSVTINGVTATEGTRGSLTDHQWCYYPATGDLPTGPPQNGWTSIIIRNTAVTSPGPIVVTIPNAEFSRWRGGNRGVQYWGTAY